MKTEVGAQLRAIRLARGLTISEVAARAGLTASHISQVERGVAQPSIGALNRICEALGTRMSSVLSLPSTSAASPLPENSVGIVRRDSRSTLMPPGTTVRHELLCPDLQHSMETFMSYIPPGADLGNPPLQHSGEEWCIVLKGSLTVIVGERSHVLEAGDAIYFSAVLPHSWINHTDEEAQVIWVATPPHF